MKSVFEKYGVDTCFLCEDGFLRLEGAISEINEKYGDGSIDSLVLYALKNEDMTDVERYAMYAAVTLSSFAESAEDSLGFLIFDNCPKDHVKMLYTAARERFDARLIIQNSHDVCLFSNIYA